RGSLDNLPANFLRDRLICRFNLEGDADEQLLIYIPFNQVIKLHSFAIKGPEEEEGI
ncbi:hypothetical protein HID58_001728, partial [Brassica napus]